MHVCCVGNCLNWVFLWALSNNEVGSDKPKDCPAISFSGRSKGSWNRFVPPGTVSFSLEPFRSPETKGRGQGVLSSKGGRGGGRKRTRSGISCELPVDWPN